MLLNDHINFGKWYSLIAGIGLILTVMNNPDGIAGKTDEQMEVCGSVWPTGQEGGASRQPAGGHRRQTCREPRPSGEEPRWPAKVPPCPSRA